MKRFITTKLAVSLAIGLPLGVLEITPLLVTQTAQAQVRVSGTFTATQTCAAPRGINGVNPGNIQTSPGQRYQAIGFNSRKQEFIQIQVPGATPERRWVKASCGTLSQTSTVISEAPAAFPTASAALQPFFDQVNNLELHSFPRGKRADITPPPPQLSEFDQAVLQTCGSIGTRVRASSFKQLMSAHPNVLRQVKAAVGGELRPVRRTEAEFLDDLTAIWSSRGGFEHIFCGEIESSQKIGGLHFFGRYLQLQNQGIAGRLPNNLQKEEVIPGVVYTLGVVVKQGNRSVSDARKGYPLVSNAQELLLEGTKAFKAQGNAQGACIYPVVDQDSGKSYQAVFVKDRSAIVTFYPDATPQGKACRNSR